MLQWWHVYNPHTEQSDEKKTILERARRQNDAFAIQCSFVAIGLLTAFFLGLLLIFS